MVKIHNFRLSPNLYYARGKNDIFPVLADCPNPLCHFHGVLWRNGFYERNAIWFDGPHRIVIQRYRCPACGHTVSLLPSFVAPHFQYAIAVIFACLRALAVMRLTLVQAASHASCGGLLTYRHVSLYKSRVVANASLYTPVLAAMGYDGTLDGDSLCAWVAEVQARGGIEDFALRFDAAWHRSFLSPPGCHQRCSGRRSQPA